MTTEDFLDILEQRQLVSKNIVGQMRRKVAAGDHRITAKSILKFLVKKELVTRAQAKELLETTLTVTPSAESSILGLIPMPQAPNQPAPEKKKTAKPAPSEPAPAAPAPEETPVVLPPVDEPADFGTTDLSGPGDLLAGSGLADAEAEHDPLAGDVESTPSTGKSIKKKKRKKRDHRKQNEWDSPLLMLGFGGLAVLIVAGVLIYYLLFRENADKLLQEAGDSFNGGSYSQSIVLYEKFVEQFPSHAEISDATVRLGMAKLWRDTDGKSDYTRALDTALQVTDEIQDEPAFNAGGDDESGLSQAKREMSELLTKIAVGLANQAEAAEDGETAQQLIEKSKTAIGLCNNTKLVPQRFRLATELDEALETLDRVEKRLTRNADLATTLAAMDEAVAAGDSAAAFAAHKALLDQYPLLANNEQLAAKIREVATAEQSLIKFTPADQPAMTEDVESPIVAALALAERSGPTAPGASGAVAVAIDGNLYGIALADGSLLWRRRTGGAAAAAPIATGDGRVIALDAAHQQVIAVDAKTGNLVWRQPLGEPLAALAVRGDRTLVAGASGKLYALDTKSGALVGHVQFGQAIRVAPTFNAKGDRVYVIGEHSNLYTLAADDLSCIGVHYVGHAKGSVTAPPFVVLNKVAVAENTGLETCQLHLVGLDKRGGASREVVTTRLHGLVLSPMLGVGRRFAALTTLGEAAVFEVGSGDDATALTELARRAGPSRKQTIPYGAMVEGPRETNLWVADRKLQKLAVLPTGNRLPVRALKRDFTGDVFDHELIEAGRLLVHVRRPRGGAGAIVAAVDDQSNEPYWETRLAVAPAGAPVVDPSGQQITSITSAGAVYSLDRQAMARRVQNEAEQASAAPLDAPLTETADLGNGRVAAATPDSPQIVHFRPGAPRGPVSLITMPSPLVGAPVAWADGFLAPSQIGQVFYYASEDGAQLAPPFQPTLTPGAKVAWLTPAAIGGESPRFAISDGVNKVLLVQVNGSGDAAQLQAAGEAEVGAAALETRLAAVGDYVVAGNADGALAVFSAADLAAGDPIALGGRVTWGPYAAGEGALVGLDSNELVLAAPGKGVAWRQPLTQQLVDAPLLNGGDAWLLMPEGALVRVSLADGSEAGRIELGEPAVAGPTLLGNRLVVAAPDGSLLIVDQP